MMYMPGGGGWVGLELKKKKQLGLWPKMLLLTKLNKESEQDENISSPVTGGSSEIPTKDLADLVSLKSIKD